MRKKLAKDAKTLSTWGRKASLQVFAACGLLLGAGMMQSCDKDILTGQPEWLGNSIYERLQEGITVNDGSKRTFGTTLRLIDDLGYRETLSKTGSKTVFATPDDVFEAWFNAKGITYDQLSLAQKKALFNNSMINNAYLLELMANVSGNPPQEGLCMRRETAATVYDSIPDYAVADMPVNPLGDAERDAWHNLRGKGQTIKIFKDYSSAPMIHFLPGFMAKNKITDSDLITITNGASQSINDSWINGKKIISAEQTCKNGYVYVVDGVIDGTKSMAEIVNTHEKTTMWAKILKRWSCPMPLTGNDLREYRALFNTQDSVYNLRYFNKSTNHQLQTMNEWDAPLGAGDVLLFDPGWNQYMYVSTDKDLHYDAGVMFVPTDEALDRWWNEEGGKSFKEEYGTWENIPIETLVKLVNVNMKESFIDAVPSKFNSVLDPDGQVPMGITPANIVESVMGCNGVVYLVDQVFAPTSYRSVLSPVVRQASTSFAIAHDAIYADYDPYDETMDFSPYLNAMDSRFSVFVPYNVAQSVTGNGKQVVRYIDPCSYGLSQVNLFEFYSDRGLIKANSYKCNLLEDGTLEPVLSTEKTVVNATIKNRLYDLLDNSIIVDDITSDREYYLTKAGSVVRAYESNGSMHLQGGYQMDCGEEIVIAPEYIYSMGATGNGTTYGVCSGADADKFISLPQTATKSVYETLKEMAAAEDSKCTLFYKLLDEDESDNSMLASMDGSSKCTNPTVNRNMTLFDSYNYTVYVPSDDAIQTLIDNGYLPTWDDYKTYMEQGDEEKAGMIAERIHDFVRYHVQDRAVCLKGGNVNAEKFESAKLNPVNKRYYTLTVSTTGEAFSVTDQLGNTRSVITSGGLYNRVCREYWIKGTPGEPAATIESSSNAVVHQIDGVLLFDESQMTRWQ